MSTKPAYRPDIDGLRAVAVLSVVLYHYGATWLPGGFTGVDIFFVISGFVITAKLKREIALGEFSILSFYEGRFRRILPALLVMLCVTMVAGWFLLLPNDYADAASSAAYAAAGLGNLYFFSNTGYFDQASEMQPLLHTWSLGVEEQFYLFWPLLLLAGLAVVKSRRLFVSLFAVGLAVAFWYAVRKTGNDPKGAFYLPHPRSWELGLGALLAFVPTMKSRSFSNGIGLAGLALIGWSLLRITSEDPFPGFNAAFACLGTALLIAPKQQTITGSMLSLRPVVFVGLLSYSLYLWHWPVLVLYRHYANDTFPSPQVAIALGALSFALAYVSWRYVEKPFRMHRGPSRGLWLPSLRPVLLGLMAIGALAMAASQITGNAGFVERLPESQRRMAGLEEMWRWECPRWVQLPFGEACNFGEPWDTAQVKAILWGDSHAQHMAPIVEAAVQGKDVSVTLAYSCAAPISSPFLFDYPEMTNYSEVCSGFNRSVEAYLADSPDISFVLIAGFWSSIIGHLHTNAVEPGDPAKGLELLTASLRNVVSRTQTPGRRVALISDVPLFLGVRPTLCSSTDQSSFVLRQPCASDNIGRTAQSFEIEQGGVIDAFGRLHEDLGAEVIATGPAMCASGECLTSLNGEFLYRDVHHLRRNLLPETKLELARLVGLDHLFD